MVDFLQYCTRCKTSNCCAQPYYGFTRECEKQRILDYCKDKAPSLKEEDIFMKCISKFEEGVNFDLIKKNIEGKCIFLDENLACTIQDVKPFDCTLWPLTIDFNPDDESVDVYLGADCLAGQELEKSNQLGEWIDGQRERLAAFVNDLTTSELHSYCSMADIPDPKYLFTIRREPRE